MSSHLAGQNSATTAPIPTITNPCYQQWCETRLDSWVTFCRDEYRLDRLYAKLIASALIPCLPHTPVWLIAETNKSPFWDHLSTSMESLGLPGISNLAGLRGTRPRYANRYVADWMERRYTHPQIFIDTHFQTQACGRGLLARHGYWQIASQCVRASIPVPLYRVPVQGVEEEMARLLRMLMDRIHRQATPEPVTLSPVLLEFIELLPRLNPELSDTSALLRNLSLLASSHAVMHGRTTMVDEDWWNLGRCLRGSVRQWTRQLLCAFYNNPGQLLSHEDLVTHSGLSKAIVVEEAARLEQAGVLRKRAMPRTKRVWLYGPTEEFGLNAVSLVATGNVKWWT